MGGGIFRADREVFPIRQDVDRDKIDRFIDFPISEPILPHIGIGDRNCNLGLDRADGSGEVGCRHLTAQQRLVADDHGGDDTRVFFGQTHHGRNLRQVLQAVTAEPYPLDDFQSHLCGETGNLIEAVFDRIGAHAIGYFSELRQILGDLFRSDMRSRQQRRLGITERRVGHAQQFGVGIDRRARQRDRRGQPPPHGSNRTQGYDQKRQWRTKRNRFHPPGGDRRLAGRQPSAKSRIQAIEGLLPRPLYHSAIKL